MHSIDELLMLDQPVDESNLKELARKNLKMLPDNNNTLHEEHEGWLDEWDRNMVHGDVIAFINILILCLDHCT